MPAAGPPAPGRASAAPASVAVADASHEPDDMAFEVAAVWTGRAVLVASGFLREIVVQRLGCAP